MLEFNATFIIAMLSFVVFIIIMNAIFYKPLLQIMQKREEYINSNYENSKKNEMKANEYLANHASTIEQTQNECKIEFKNTVNKLQTEADIKISELKNQSKAEVKNRKEELYQQENHIKATINETIVKDLANSITTKLLGADQKSSKCKVKNIK